MSFSPLHLKRSISYRLSSFVSRCRNQTRGLCTWPVLTPSLLLILSLFLLSVSTTNKCSMTANLAPLLLYSASALSDSGIAYFLDYGTLLGAVRDGGIIEHDFDIDIGLMESDCDKVGDLKQVFLRDRGYHVYVRGDYIAAKRNFWLGYDAYLHSPCARIYDADEMYYIDVYWYRKETPKSVEEMRKKGQHFNPPVGWDDSIQRESSETLVKIDDRYDLVCNDDAYETMTPGGCRWYTSTFPLTSTPFLSTTLRVPFSPEAHLNEIYGKDGWRVPIGKGYKRFICSGIPSPMILMQVSIILAILVVGFGTKQWVRLRGAAAGGTGNGSIRSNSETHEPLNLKVPAETSTDDELDDV